MQEDDLGRTWVIRVGLNGNVWIFHKRVVSFVPISGFMNVFSTDTAEQAEALCDALCTRDAHGGYLLERPKDADELAQVTARFRKAYEELPKRHEGSKDYFKPHNAIRVTKHNHEDVDRTRGIRLYKESPESWQLQLRAPIGVGSFGLRDGKDFVVAGASCSLEDLRALRDVIDVQIESYRSKKG